MVQAVFFVPTIQIVPIVRVLASKLDKSNERCTHTNTKPPATLLEAKEKKNKASAAAKAYFYVSKLRISICPYQEQREVSSDR